MKQQRQHTTQAPRPGNRSATQRPEDKPLYRATVRLFKLLQVAPAAPAMALAHMRKVGIGVNTTYRAAALLEVPTHAHYGRPCVWELPERCKRIEHLYAVLKRIEIHGPRIGNEARTARRELLAQWRGGGKLGMKQFTKPLGPHHVRKSQSHEILSPKERKQ